MAQTESQIVASELERVRPVLEVLFERDDNFLSSIEKKNVEPISKRQMRVPLEIRPGGNFGHWNPAGGDLGRGDGPTEEVATLTATYLKHGIEYQTETDYVTDDKRKAIVQNTKRLLAKAMAEFRRQIDSALMTAGDGVVGTISAISTAGGKDTYTLNTDGFGARLVRFGQWLAVYDTALAGNRTITPASGSLDGIAAQVDFHDGPNKQIRLNGAAAGVTIGDKLVLNGLSGATPTSIFGVPYHHSNASTGTWQGLARSSNPEIRANRVNAAGALSLPFARRAINAIGDRVGMDHNTKLVAWMHPCQKQAYEELGQLVSVIQKSAKEEALDLYFGDNMQMAGASVKTSYSWDKTRIDFVVSDVWGRAETKGIGYYEVDGRKVFEIRGASGGVAASNIFYLVFGGQFFTVCPPKISYIDGLTVPTGY